VNLKSLGPDLSSEQMNNTGEKLAIGTLALSDIKDNCHPHASMTVWSLQSLTSLLNSMTRKRVLYKRGGFELCEKILAIDINVRVYFMSSGEINLEALREIYPTRQEGCFIRKPVTIDYLLERIRSELD
jgi:hypothetical protein